MLEAAYRKPSHDSASSQSRHESLLQKTLPVRSALLRHPIYRAVRDLRSLRVFMAAHVYAVWDFMSLLKALQRRMTCVAVPWTQPKNRRAARLINEIVLAEESDEVAPGLVMSHFELYVDAMRDIGVESRGVLGFSAAIRSGASLESALSDYDVPDAAQRFVRATLAVAEHGTDVEVAASFLHGREDLVPQMFRRLLLELPVHEEAPSLRLYLSRHIEVDEQQHGPAAVSLLASLCLDDAQRWGEATGAAQAALRERIALWDGIYASLSSGL